MEFKLTEIHTEEQRAEIKESYKWVKVKKFVDDKTLSWEERFNALQKHHVEETAFLIDKKKTII